MFSRAEVMRAMSSKSAGTILDPLPAAGAPTWAFRFLSNAQIRGQIGK
jgi:hypothetical protein